MADLMPNEPEVLGLAALIAPTIGATVGYAAALGKAVGPEEGLEAFQSVDPIVRSSFAPAEATRAYLLSAMGDRLGAAQAYEQAIALTSERPLREYLQAKRADLQNQPI